MRQELHNEVADEAVKRCPMGVFDIEDIGKGQRRARVARPRDCTMCRECIREGDWSEKIKLEVSGHTREKEAGQKGVGRVRSLIMWMCGCGLMVQRVADHFIFSIESVGSMDAQAILKEVRRLKRSH